MISELINLQGLCGGSQIGNNLIGKNDMWYMKNVIFLHMSHLRSLKMKQNILVTVHKELGPIW